MRMMIAVLLLNGCAGQLVGIDHNNPPPADWPTLKEYVVYVQELDGRCRGAVTPTGAMGCSVHNFAGKVCMIYLASKDPALLEHERWHCRGYDHVGRVNRAGLAWEQWKRSHGK